MQTKGLPAEREKETTDTFYAGAVPSGYGRG